MTNSLCQFRRFSSSRRLSDCALVALTFLSSSRSSDAWTITNRFSQNQSIETLSKLSMSTVSEASVSTFTVAQFNCLGDNYGYLLHDPSTGETAAVDTPCGKTYKEELERRGWKLTHILNTHHHHDHTGGNLELKEKGVTIVGPVNEKQKIPGIDKPVGDGDAFEFGNSNVVVMDAGGHTKGHVAFYFPDQSMVFVGDCLFSLGCGKMFEGNPTQFWSSLEGLRALPDDTLVYCGHEYTQNNGKFAMSVEPGNKHLVDAVALVKAKRARNEPTVPSLLGEEKKANPFLRVDFSEEIRKNIGVADDDTPAEAFSKLRKAKDNF